MDAVKSPGGFRVHPLVEWLIAAAFLVGILAVGSLVLRELSAPSRVRAALPPVAAPDVASIPPAVPSRAVSVPVLPLQDGKEVRVGQTAGMVAASLGRSAESGRQEVDGGTLGERLTRFYEYAGTQFILVFEPFERNGEPRVAAIYLP
jgi:hypothetical protein